MTFIVIFKDI
jgi:hypothetical protein